MYRSSLCCVTKDSPKVATVQPDLSVPRLRVQWCLRPLPPCCEVGLLFLLSPKTLSKHRILDPEGGRKYSHH
jgi:hypothetical protein